MSIQATLLAVVNRLALGPASAADLAQALALSQSTLSRALRTLEINQQVLRMGSTRGARYALRRKVAAIGSQWPIYRVDEEGTPKELGELHALTQDGYYVTRGPSGSKAPPRAFLIVYTTRDPPAFSAAPSRWPIRNLNCLLA